MAGIYVPWLVEAARLTGYPVVEVAGWRTRGHGGLSSVEGVVVHHTAGPSVGEMPSLAVVRDGRAGLAGPLSQLGLGRSGTVYVIAAGLAYHAGASAWADMTALNSRFLGIEAEDDGDGTWTPAQLDCYPRLCAALCHYMRRDASRVAAHREVALPKGRKPDPTGIDMAAFRRQITRLLADPLTHIPRGAMAKAQEEDTMTPEDWVRIDQRFADLWGLWNVRQDETGAWRDRLTDLWDVLTAVQGDVRELRTSQPDTAAPTAGVATLSDAQLAHIGDAVADELARRMVGRPGAS